MKSFYLVVASLSASLVAACEQPGDPTWSDISPIVAARCSACHRPQGVNPLTFDYTTAQALAALIRARLASRQMPPWAPSDEGLPIASDRRMTDDERAVFIAWTLNPLFGAVPIARNENASPDMILVAPVIQPTGKSNEYRCVLIGRTDATITATRWRIEGPAHHVNLAVLDAAARLEAERLAGADAAPGYDCTDGFGVGVRATLGNTSTSNITRTEMPPGWGATVPPGGDLLLQVHTLSTAAPVSVVVEIWVTREATREVSELGVAAPSEVPCPVEYLASSACARETAIANPKVQEYNDLLLQNCETNLAAYLSRTTYPGSGGVEIGTSCEQPILGEGEIGMVQLHGHFYTRSMRASLVRASGEVTTLLHIPKWRPEDEDFYSLVTPVRVSPTDRLRVEAVLDNSESRQPSARTGEFGLHGQSAELPLRSPKYLVGGPSVFEEMTVLRATWVRSL